MDMTTLAALLGHSKLNMVMRYAHPQEQHQADAVRRLEIFNAAKETKEIAEVEKNRAVAGERQKVVPIVSDTIAKNAADFQTAQSGTNSNQVN